ncbi:MAG: hypothetical protein LUP91_10020 [Methylococcaceae bacterium]|nr:hypothetical protein [Methylococcaceae bacterium]
MRRFAGLGIAVAALALSACAQNLVQVRDIGAGNGEALALSRVAVAPFRAAPRAGAAALPSDATALVASYVAEGFGARGVDTVPASDVASALGSAEIGADLNAALAVARDKFGADALVAGSVHRFRDRDGQAMGSVNPASVGFEVKIYRAADGKLLWSGVFDHTQVALSANALTAAQYPGGGSRWMTSAELARWGTLRLVREVPLATK